MAYPPLYYIRGFAKRWQAEVGDDSYLVEWDNAIKQLQWRLDIIKDNNFAVKSCLSNTFPTITFELIDMTRTKAPNSAIRKTCEGEENHCEVLLMYGYYTYFLQKIRNHLMYETAREVTVKKYPQDAWSALMRALNYARDAKALVDSDGLRLGNCFTQQRFTYYRDGELHSDVTTTNPEHEYAATLDSYGSLILARAFKIDAGDKKAVESAIGMFESSLKYSVAARDPRWFTETIREHYETARGALGLATR